jgi:hypothetical protein
MVAGAATTTVVIKHQTKPHGGHLAGQPVIWDKAALANAGYQTPQATLMTMLWATSNGDTDAFLSCLTPEAKARQEKQWRGKSKEALTAEGKQQLAGVTGIKVLNQAIVSDDRAIVTVSLEGIGKTEQIPLLKIGDDWKVAR